jgi:hypothetical protein
MVDVAFDVGGSVNHRQSGAKSTIGVASDQVVVYYDPDDMEGAQIIIERTMRLHQYAKEIKSGLIPARQRVSDPNLDTVHPGKAQ